MLTVACVLRSGPEFKPEHVWALRLGIRPHLSGQYRFVCLTDLVAEVEAAGLGAIPLVHAWPGWWSKIELFRPGLFDGPVFYADLDTVIVGPLDDLVKCHHFTVLENFWHPGRIGSGLMAWEPASDLSQIYRRFSAAPELAMRQYTTAERWGDQGFIRFNTPTKPALWQSKHPGQVVSYRRHVVPAGRLPDGARVICFGGKARPWNSPALWDAPR